MADNPENEVPFLRSMLENERAETARLKSRIVELEAWLREALKNMESMDVMLEQEYGPFDTEDEAVARLRARVATCRGEGVS